MTMQVMLRKANVFTRQPAHHAHSNFVILVNLAERFHNMVHSWTLIKETKSNFMYILLYRLENSCSTLRIMKQKNTLGYWISRYHGPRMAVLTKASGSLPYTIQNALSCTRRSNTRIRDIGYWTLVFILHLDHHSVWMGHCCLRFWGSCCLHLQGRNDTVPGRCQLMVLPCLL